MWETHKEGREDIWSKGADSTLQRQFWHTDWSVIAA